jgi:hypothetical protein
MKIIYVEMDGIMKTVMRTMMKTILITEHNVVMILEIVYDRGIIHENKRVNIELIIK